MKILGICGSPRKKNSTTFFALEKAMEEIRSAGMEGEIISLADYNLSGCTDCGGCKKKLDCTIDDDFTTELLPKLTDPALKGFLFASPVYFGGMTSQLKAFFDRCVLFRRNGFRFENMVAGALTVGRSRNGGQELAAFDIIRACLIQGMVVVPDSSPTSHFGGILWSGHPESIEQDEAGLNTAVNLAKKIAEITKKMNS